MTNDEAPMTRETAMLNAHGRQAIGHCRLPFDWSLMLGH
jgi:hypothetical protein